MSSWSIDQIRYLITLYKDNVLLYDVANSKYHNKSARTETLEKMAIKLSETVRPRTKAEEIKAKINGLRTQFSREVNAMKKFASEGAAETPTPKLWCFKELLFLQDYVHAGSRKSNTQKQDDELQALGSSGESFQDAKEENDDELTNLTHEEIVLEAETIAMRTPTPPTSSHRVLRQDETIGNFSKKRKINSLEMLRTRVSENSNNKIADVSIISEDSEQIFANYIAAELRTFTNEDIKRRCKRELTRLLLDFQDTDDEN